MATAEEKIQNVLDELSQGVPDGDHHKMWVIDQVVRILTDCPEVEATARDYRGDPYTYLTLGESDEYLEWVAAVKDGEDGPETYEWDTGIPA